MQVSLSSKPSYLNDLFPAHRGTRPKISRSSNIGPSILEHDLASRPRQGRDLSDDPKGERVFKQLRSMELYTHLYRSLIKEHLGRRADLAFIRFVMCDQTGFEFENRHYPDQVKGVGKVWVKYRGDKERIEFEAAHSATSPRLVFSMPGSPDQFYNFLEGSAVWNSWSATIELPKSVNLVDSDVDFQKVDPNLRWRLRQEIEAVADGQATPFEAHERFIEELSDTLEEESEEGSTLAHRTIAQIHLQTLSDYREALSMVHRDHLLGLHLEGVDDADEIRRHLYPVRGNALRRRNERQSFFHRAFMRVATFIKDDWGRQPDFLHDVLRVEVFTWFDLPDRELFEEMFSQTLGELEQRTSQGKAATTTAIVSEYEDQLEALQEAAQTYVRKAHKEERLYRAAALKVLRTVRSVSQARLGKAIGIRQQRVSDVEKGKLELTDAGLEGAAEFFGIKAINLVIDLRTSQRDS